MKMYKIIGFVFLMLFSLISVNATMQSNNLLNYGWDNNNFNDLSSNGNYGTNFGSSNTSGIYRDSRSFDGVSQYVATTGTLPGNVQSWSVNYWVNWGTAIPNFLVDSDGTASEYISFRSSGATRDLVIQTGDSAGTSLAMTPFTVGTGWHMVTLIKDKSNDELRVYLDSASIENITDTRTGNWNLNDWTYGARRGGTNFYNGDLDEVSIFGDTITGDDITYLYASGSPGLFQQYPYSLPIPTIEFQNVTINNQTNFNATWYNSTPQLIEVTLNQTYTNNDINTTIDLYNSTNDLVTSNQFITNSLTGDYNISFPYEDNFKFNLQTLNNETNASDPLFGNYSIGYDITPPNISIIGNLTVDTFEVNFSTIFNVTDSLSGLASCTINITYLENITNPEQFDSFINCTNTQTFSALGTYNGFLEATDNAGNLATLSVNGTINPLIFIHFFDITHNIFVDDYSVNILSPNGISSTQNDVNGSIVLSPKDNGNLDLGNYTLEFIKFGYPIENFTQLINLTNAGQNFTFNVTPVTLTIQVLDESNHTKQLTFDVTLENSTTIQVFNNQINFSQQINNITFGNIIILIESEGYSSRKIFTTILPYTSISFVIHLLNSSLSTPIIFEVSDIAGAIPIEDATLNFFKLIGNATELMGQARTDSQGTTFFNMGIDDEYEIVISADLFETVTFNSVPGRVLYPILMTKIGAETDFIFNTFGYKFSPTTGFVTSLPFNGSVQVSDNDAAITFMTFTITGTNTSLQTTSTNPSGATLGPLLITNFSEEYLFNLTVIRNGQTLSFFKTITFLNETDSSTSLKAAAEQLQGEENNADRIAMMIIFYVFFVGLGTIIGGPLFGTMAGLIPISLFVMVGWFSATSDVTNAGAGLLLGLFTVMGGLFFNR